jgi:sugar lactone lactonase YvrE
MLTRPAFSVVLASLLACATTGALPAETPPAGILELAIKTREARLAGDNEAWLRHGRETLNRAPEHPDLQISVARALAANGRLDESLAHLEQAIGRGAGFDPMTLPEFKDVSGNARFTALAERARSNQAPVLPAEVYVTVEQAEVSPEGITWDAATERLFIGSLEGAIWQVSRDRTMTRFAGPETGLREVLGLKVDAGRRLLWAVSGVFPDLFGAQDAPKKDVGLTSVVAFDLDSARPVGQCVLDERPTLHGFNDLALARNGDVYVSDSTASAIYRLPRGECRLERLVQDPLMGFPNGIALSADESRLYVAHIEGLSAVDLATGRRTQLPVPEGATVNSMDGLVSDGADLIGIQPSPYLARVIRIRLRQDGLAVREVSTLSSRPPHGVSQTTGTVAAPHYFSVAGIPDALAGNTAADRRARILRTLLR